ncbi:MAG: hypothetical protein PHH36_04930 [Sideroxydans sp.]|nr:hypothetical protein [Sideroxydans sp.]
MAMRVDVAVENIQGIAIDMLNLASVNQKLGRLQEAHAYLDALLQDEAVQYGSAYLAAAATQKALLLLQQGESSDVRSWLDKAEGWCVSECRLKRAIDNARAALALHEKDYDGALHWAERAASASRGDDPLEHANAMRYMSEARLARSEFDLALRLASDTLALDKTLGLPEKIKQDLLLSARAYEGQGNAVQAKHFRERASRIVVR